MDIEAEDLTVVLGGVSTTSMEIDYLALRYGVAGLKRSPELKSLTTTTFLLISNDAMTDLSVGFDSVTNFVIREASSLRTLEFSPAAVG